jgi:putative pyruvate formate lyase activating enzyme
MPQILKALEIARAKGLNLPIVYNTSGYELPEIISFLDGAIDVYLADMRYGESGSSKKYSSAPDYPDFNMRSIREMHRQVGIPEFDENGIIRRGLIIRHLVLPNRLSGTEKIMKFLHDEVSPETYISLMSQYSPYYKSGSFSEINRRITQEEYEEAKGIMEKFGLENGWVQDSFGLERFAGVHIKSNISEGNNK